VETTDETNTEWRVCTSGPWSQTYKKIPVFYNIWRFVTVLLIPLRIQHVSYIWLSLNCAMWLGYVLDDPRYWFPSGARFTTTDYLLTSHRHLLLIFIIKALILPKAFLYVNITRAKVLHNCDGYMRWPTKRIPPEPLVALVTLFKNIFIGRLHSTIAISLHKQTTSNTLHALCIAVTVQINLPPDCITSVNGHDNQHKKKRTRSLHINSTVLTNIKVIGLQNINFLKLFLKF
jgi:hypothetical protein